MSPEKKVLATCRNKARRENKAKHTVTNEMEMKKNFESLLMLLSIFDYNTLSLSLVTGDSQTKRG